MTKTPPSQPAQTTTRRAYAGLAVVALGTALPTMDIAVNVAFPAITAAFGLDPRGIRWTVVCYVVTYACLMLAFGRLGDVIGHRRVFHAGLLVGLAAYVGCALAPTYPWLLGTRIVQGVSTALLLSCAPALATQLFDEARRMHALGVHASTTALAAVIAPMLGGLSIAWIDWSGVFWLRVPIAALALLCVHWLPDRRPAPRTVDRAGPPLLAAAIACLLLAPGFVDTAGTGSAAAAAGAGLCCLLLFLRQQRRTHTPLMPAGCTRDPDFLLHNLMSMALQLCAFAVPLIVPYYLERVAGSGPTGIGAALTLAPLGALVGSSVATRLARRLGARAAVLIAVGMLGLGTLCIGQATAGGLPAPIVGGLLMHGVGLGLFQVVYTDTVVAALPHDARGVAGSLTMLTRTLGVVIAAALLTALMTDLEATRLAAGQDARMAYEGAFGTVFGLLFAVPLAGFVVIAVRQSLFRAGRCGRADTSLP